MEPFIEKINARALRVVVIGLGYVGLPQAVALAEAGFEVIGIDSNQQKVAQVNRGESYISNLDGALLKSVLATGRLICTTDLSAVQQGNVVIICVPTPLRKPHAPDLSAVNAVLESLCHNLQTGQLILLESTTYPGTTEEVLLPALEATGRKVGKDFFLAFSPERIDPGNTAFDFKNTPKVVGGITPVCTQYAAHFYAVLIDRVVTVSSTRVAETAKLLENTFRAVNIGLANEFALMCHTLRINVWEVIEAAATKPFGYMPFFPGPGIGGHCIPVDPLYLAWKLEGLNYHSRFIALAAQMNASMPYYIVQRVCAALNERQRCLNAAKILLLGVAYKKNINDVREAPALPLIQALRAQQAIVDYNDEYIPQLDLPGGPLFSVPLTAERIRAADCIILLADHDYYDLPWVVRHASLVFDTRNMAKGMQDAKIIRL